LVWGWQTSAQAQRAREGDHGTVIGTEFGFGETNANAQFGFGTGELFAQQAIRADAAGHDQSAVSGCFECAQ
jgi:hypothetical protein